MALAKDVLAELRLVVAGHRGHTHDLTRVDGERDIALVHPLGRIRYVGGCDLEDWNMVSRPADRAG